MLKAALLCSAVCTAFVVGDRTTVASQEKSVRFAKSVHLHEVLQRFVGKACYVSPKSSGGYWISFEKRLVKDGRLTFDMLGVDFIRVSSKDGKTHIPFSSISAIDID